MLRVPCKSAIKINSVCSLLFFINPVSTHVEIMCLVSKVPFAWNYCKRLKLVNLWLSKMLFYHVWSLGAISTPTKIWIFKDFSVQPRSVVQKKGENSLPRLTTNTSDVHDSMMEVKIAFNRMRSWTQQWNKPSHHTTKYETSEGLQMLPSRTQDQQQKQTKVFSWS